MRADGLGVQTTVRVRRWRRYGADRAFVVDSCGSHLGSVDLTSGEVDLVEPEHDGQVRHAVQVYLRADLDEVLVPQQRAPLDGFSPGDEQILRQWLGAPIMLGGPSHVFRTVRAQLERLAEDGWTVVHQVPLGLQGSSCPHLVVGPPGVFTVRRVGRVGAQVEVDGAVLRIDGAPVTMLRDAVFEARRIRTLLVGDAPCRLHVRPVLAVTGDLTTTGASFGPLVVPACDVDTILHNLDRTLLPAERLALSRVVRRESTWWA